MNTGIIAGRYSDALLRFAQGRGSGEAVCRQAQSLLEGSVSGEELLPELERFIRVLEEAGRLKYLRLSLKMFIEKYLESQGKRRGKLFSAGGESSEALDKALLEWNSRRQGEGSELLLEKEKDGELLGGFILETGGQRLDYSVSGALERIRAALLKD